ncbi:MAG: cytochrome c3 family protein [Nitrospirae bacterium]|nr:cytochrome c3 family protein [Nitrospirota bacterium]
MVLWAWAAALLFPAAAPAQAPPASLEAVEDIAKTKHNLSSRGISAQGVNGQRVPGYNVYSPETGEICVFCHTPHGGSAEAAQIRGPLWNRHLSSAAYKLYDQVWSRSFEGDVHPGAPTGYSRLCLSCHDGTIALGSVVNAPGSGGYSATPQDAVAVVAYPDTATRGIVMPQGGGQWGGDTRRLGTNLTNDHPVSFRFDSALAQRDTELVDPGPPLDRIGANSPIFPLRRAEGNVPGVYDAVQCTSCHNPHAVTYPKFLRAPIWQDDPPGSDILCLNCHEKPGWRGSTHAASPATRNTYPGDPGNPPENFGYDFDGQHTVAQTACRNCHDPHTAQGAKRLHREGASEISETATDAVEHTCFMCHAPNTAAVPSAGSQMPYYLPAGDFTSPTFPRFLTDRVAPDIYSHFNKDQNTPNCQPALNATGPRYLPDDTRCGSAMNLSLASGHEPVFIASPGEGVELNSPAPPAGNEGSIGLAKPDNTHIECTDCHNPHQVVPENRLKGMRGIDINGNVVGPGVPGNDREVYVYEVCFRCHANSYTTVFTGDRFPDDTVHRSDPRDLTPTNPSFSYRGFSNKRKEFDPNTPDTAVGHTMQPSNAAFHPVAVPGRNRSPQLDKQLQMSGSGLTVDSTIQCTDCHNANETSVVPGPVTESNLRATDAPSNFQPLKALFPEYPAIGPHGSTKLRILRNNYNTDILNPERCYEGQPSLGGEPPGSKACTLSDGGRASHWDNFLLCFQCHDRRAFDPFAPGHADPDLAMRDSSWTRFFGSPPNTTPGHWDGNLHMYHLRFTGAYCHECHYNVHSNVEATNTIYGDGTGDPAFLPPDATDGNLDGVINTHLINFGPQADGTIDIKPKWTYDPVADEFTCNLRCHGENMDNCRYQSPRSGSSLQGGEWCAGGTIAG